MIVAILLAYLNRIGQRRHFRDVFLGVAAALLVDARRRHRGVRADQPVRRLERPDLLRDRHVPARRGDPHLHDVLDAAPRPLAHPASSSGAATRRSRGGTRVGFGLLAFQAVGREGLETMVFTLAIVFASAQAGRDARPRQPAPLGRGARPGRRARHRLLRSTGSARSAQPAGGSSRSSASCSWSSPRGCSPTPSRTSSSSAGCRSASTCCGARATWSLGGQQPRRRPALAARLRRPPDGAAGRGLGRLPRDQPDGVPPPLAQVEAAEAKGGDRRCAERGGSGDDYVVDGGHRLNFGKRGALASGVVGVAEPVAGVPVALRDREHRLVEAPCRRRDPVRLGERLAAARGTSR